MIPEPLVEKLASAHGVLITSHANPDGDAIGSELGLAGILRGQGKRVAIWNHDATPAAYAMLPGASSIHFGGVPPDGFPEAFDLGVVLECPQLERSGLAAAVSRLPLLNIDHHLGNTHYGVANWVDPSRAAVAVMVAELARSLGAAIDSDAASCLFVGLATDTGGFRFANATDAAFDAAAQLVRDGASVETVSQWLYERQPEPAIRLLGELLGTLERHHRGTIATVHLTLDMFARCGASAGDSEGLIDTPRSIDGVRAVALFRELEADLWKVSLRSRGAVDVQAIARRHDGGGHKNAAGCRFAGPLATAESLFVAELATAIAEAR